MMVLSAIISTLSAQSLCGYILIIEMIWVFFDFSFIISTDPSLTYECEWTSVIQILPLRSR